LDVCFRDAETFLRLNRKLPRTTFHFSPNLSTPINSATPGRTIVLKTGLGKRFVERFTFEFPGDGTFIGICHKTEHTTAKLQVDDPLAYMKFLYECGIANAHDLAEETATIAAQTENGGK
jgi:hypothetical protein